MTFFDIGIPCYEYHGRGAEVLQWSFDRILSQTFKDFRVVICDHSKDDKIRNLCEEWKDAFPIKYVKNEQGRGIVAANLNCVLDNCDAPYIKLMDQDDYFCNEFALKHIFDGLSNDDVNFLATPYVHTRDKQVFFNYHVPQLNSLLCIENTIGTCSCVTFRNFGSDMPRFDENLRYAHDCDWYYRYILKYGKVAFIREHTIVNFLWENSVTSTVTQELIFKENRYILEKYK